jgi:hypothetical protein
MGTKWQHLTLTLNYKSKLFLPTLKVQFLCVKVEWADYVCTFLIEGKMMVKLSLQATVWKVLPTRLFLHKGQSIFYPLNNDFVIMKRKKSLFSMSKTDLANYENMPPLKLNNKLFQKKIFFQKNFFGLSFKVETFKVLAHIFLFILKKKESI